MIMTVEELRRYINTEDEDRVLEDKLQALELSIQGYTNNNFKRVLSANNGEYPMDIKMGVAALFVWEYGIGQKMGIASESISRHSVTYESTSNDQFAIGYPKRLLGFLQPYQKARFGQGLGV